MRSTPSDQFLLILLVGLVLPSSTSLHAAQPAPAAAVARPTGPTGIVMSPVDPMASEMLLEIERQQSEYARLFTQLAQARGESEAFAIQTELRQSQIGLQLSLLRIQAAYAHRSGRERLAWHLERTIEELVAPENSPGR